MDFHFRAAAVDGSIITGVRNAEGSEQLAVALKNEGLIPLEIRAGNQTAIPMGFQNIGRRDLLVFSQQLAGLLQAGIRLNRSLDILTDLSKGRLHTVLMGICRDIREGSSFSAALEKHPKTFDKAYVTMVKAGEASGRLPEVLGRIADSIEAELDFLGEVLSSLLYPGLVTIVSISGLTALMTMVVPRFEDLFRRMGQNLPWMTRVVMVLSHTVTRYGLAGVIILGIAAFAAFSYFSTPKGRTAFDHLLCKTPIIGKLILNIEMERLTRMLSLLMGSGVTLLNSLQVLADIIRNRVLSQTIVNAAEAVRAGNSLSRYLAGQPIFPPLAVAMIGIGEEAGNLGPMMDQVAKVYSRETRQSFRRIASLIGPVLIMVLAGFVFLIALAILLPVFQLRIEG